MEEHKSNKLSKSNKTLCDDEHSAETRRRGEILEDAILEAAWDELSEFGYAHLTMNAVAARAKTNKSVLYRRWASKSKLVMAVIHKHVHNTTTGVPDTGDLHNDVHILLMGIAKPLQIIGPETLHGLMVEHLDKNLISSLPKMLHPGTEYESTTAMTTILKNAELRGEINFKKISPRIISLPMDLIRYEVLTTHEPISDRTLNEIIDDIFLPLLHL